MKKGIRSRLEAALTRFPGLYARLIARSRTPNIEKIVFLSLIRRGDVVVDAGANTGYYTLLFSRLVGGRGEIHAFEPVPPTFAELEARLRRVGNVALNNHALADEDKDALMYLPGSDHGQAALARHRFGSWAVEAPVQTFSCRTATLDSYVGSRDLRSLRFIKCDVEGAELLVLRGATRTIRLFKPLLFLEVNRHWTADFAYEPADLARLVQSFGYSRFFLVTDELVPLAELARDLAADRLPDSASLLCAHDGHHLRRLARLRPWLRGPDGRPAS